MKACGGVVRGPGLQIFSPGYPENYPDNMDCAWLVSFEQNTARVSSTRYLIGQIPVEKGGGGPMVPRVCATVLLLVWHG